MDSMVLGRKYLLKSWSGRRDSNPRPSAWEADTLPTELLPPRTTGQKIIPRQRLLGLPAGRGKFPIEAHRDGGISFLSRRCVIPGLSAARRFALAKMWSSKT